MPLQSGVGRLSGAATRERLDLVASKSIRNRKITANRWLHSKAFTRVDRMENSLKLHEGAVKKTLYQP